MTEHIVSPFCGVVGLWAVTRACLDRISWRYLLAALGAELSQSLRFGSCPLQLCCVSVSRRSECEVVVLTHSLCVASSAPRHCFGATTCDRSRGAVGAAVDQSR